MGAAYKPLPARSTVSDDDESQDEAPRQEWRSQPALSIFRPQALLSLIFCTVLATVIVVCTAVIADQLEKNRLSSCSEAPRFLSAYGRDLTYASLDHKFDPQWDAYPDEFVIGLPDDEHGDEPQPAIITMIHQLHCLSSLRRAIQMAREGQDPGLDWRSNPHWPHCLDYLRQSILCSADDTIERETMFNNGSATGFIDGSQDVRRCGDSKRLFKMMEDFKPIAAM